jgi:endonuclease/exonuclease/phosphatase family metal-dependent hydrolase
MKTPARFKQWVALLPVDADTNRPASRPSQLDYVFASDSLVPQVSACTVRDEDAAWALSDHCPIVIGKGRRPGPLPNHALPKLLSPPLPPSRT